MKWTACLVGAILLVAASPAVGQDQTVIVADELRLCAVPESVTNDVVLTQDDALALIQYLFNGQVDPHTYYMIHVVEYVPHRLVVAQQKWYVYYQRWHHGITAFDRWTDTRINSHFTETRIFGSPRLAMVYLHRNVDAVAKNAQGETPGALQSDPITGAARNVLIDKVLDGEETGADELVDTSTKTSAVRLTPQLLSSQTFAALATLEYKIAITKKVPAPQQNFNAVLKIAANAGPGQFASVATTPQPLCAGRTFTTSYLPSDMEVTGTSGTGQQQKAIGKQTFDNERKYWYDISFALPLKSHNQLALTESAQLTAKKVQKTDLFAVLNLSLPFDTKKPQAQLFPVLLYGIPITGKPLQHHLVAVAIGLNRVQAFAGVRIDRTVQVSVESSGDVTTGVEAPDPGKKWRTTFTWGINIPVSTVASILKGK
jgi:hypothetical protein